MLLNIALISDMVSGTFLSPTPLTFEFTASDFQLALQLAIPMIIVGASIERIPLKLFQEIAQDTKIFVLTMFGRSSSLFNTAVAAFIVSLGAGISEEIFFRGIVHNIARNYFGDTPATLISSG